MLTAPALDAFCQEIHPTECYFCQSVLQRVREPESRDRLAARSENTVCVLCPCFCFQWLFLVCSNGWVKLRKMVGFGLHDNETQVMKPRFGFENKPSHYTAPLRNGAGKSIFPPEPASHNMVCHHQWDYRLVLRSMWWRGNEIQMVAEASWRKAN